MKITVERRKERRAEESALRLTAGTARGSSGVLKTWECNPVAHAWKTDWIVRIIGMDEREDQELRKEDERKMLNEVTMDNVLDPSNLKEAHRVVRANGGAAGVDGMSAEAFAGHLSKHWPVIREKVSNGKYKPAPVKRVWIEKPSGGQRPLGIPSVFTAKLRWGRSSKIKGTENEKRPSSNGGRLLGPVGPLAIV